jgi:hypothetical protein
MGIFDFIFGKTINVEDEFFVKMLFVENKKDPSKSYFECRRYFDPTGKIIEIMIDGETVGPSQKQINFFKSIEGNYQAITTAISPLIEEEFGNWKEDFKIKDFQQEFEAVSLQLPRCEDKPILWEIAFESYHDRNHTFTITMSDFDPREILIDG